MTLHAATPLHDLTEKEWQGQIVALARTLGWTRIYHTYRSTKSSAGFPDLVLARDRVLFVEVKSETGKLSGAQEDWLDGLRCAGAETYVWRPSDLEQVARVLQRREAAAA